MLRAGGTDDFGSFPQEAFMNVQGGEKPDLILCCKAEDTVLHAALNDFSGRPRCLQAEHQAESGNRKDPWSPLQQAAEKR